MGPFAVPKPIDLERVRAVTANYFFWQGLRWVPMGALFVLSAAAETRWWPLPQGWTTAIVVASVILALATMRPIGRYYRRRFGDVEGCLGQHAHRNAMKWMIVYPAMALSLVIDFGWRPQLFVSGLVWGAAVYAYWHSTGRGRPHYPIAAAMIAAISVLPLFGIIPPGVPAINVLIATIGCVYMVGGVLDHLELGRVLDRGKLDRGQAV